MQEKSLPVTGVTPERYRRIEMRMVRRSVSSYVTAVCLALALSACATTDFRPFTPADTDFAKRAITRTQRDITVTAGVPTAEEFKSLSGVDVYADGIQPVWISITNNRDEPLRLIYSSIDPDYYSPLEVAWFQRSHVRKRSRADMERWFYENSLQRGIPAGATRSGFVYTHEISGTKGFNVDIHGEAASGHFTFFVPIPGYTPDYKAVDFASLYSEDEYFQTDREGLRQAIAQLPCCTTDETGELQGDPLNIIVIGTRTALRRTLLRARWSDTELASPGTATARSHRYRGRRPDGTFLRSRPDGNERKELRLWLTPIRLGEQAVWIGHVSYEMSGSLLSLQPTRFQMDPDVDDARNYLLQNFWYSQSLAAFAMASGAPRAPIEAPLANFNDEQFFSDGRRAVLFLSEDPVSLSETEIVVWERFIVR